jgi:hypothetical protein
MSDMIAVVPPTSILLNADNVYQTIRGHTPGYGNPNSHRSQDVSLNCN